jgi:hypothetical protein
MDGSMPCTSKAVRPGNKLVLLLLTVEPKKVPRLPALEGLDEPAPDTAQIELPPRRAYKNRPAASASCGRRRALSPSVPNPAIWISASASSRASYGH